MGRGTKTEWIFINVVNDVEESLTTRKFKDLTGKVYGELTVMSLDRYDTEKRLAYWNCECTCGNPRIASAYSLTKSDVVDCGDYFNHKKFKPIEVNAGIQGLKLGKMSYIQPLVRNNIIYWEYRCDCGMDGYIKQNRIEKSSTRSCGCDNGKPGHGPGIVPPIFGKRYGCFTVTDLADNPEGSANIHFVVECDCGHKDIVELKYINLVKEHNCGAKYKFDPELSAFNPYGTPKRDIKGLRRGKIVADEFLGKTFGGSGIWRCKCDCGNYHYLTDTTENLGAYSCGCYRPYREG
ncbi:hypothetical protein ABGV42_00925 [Paenibacillus pabuli]|uniref:hypothetical protein n=1 Tax=Paenibacillus pabuli TaxID=1472 RepID=UPI00324257FB